MINRAGLQHDCENGQPIAGGGGFFRFLAAVGPEDCGNSRCATYANRVALDGLCEFAIDIDDAIGAVGRCRVGCPAATIIGGQWGSW